MPPVLIGRTAATAPSAHGMMLSNLKWMDTTTSDLCLPAHKVFVDLFAGAGNVLKLLSAAEQRSEEFGKSCQISVVTSPKGISASKPEIVHTADLLEEQRASKTQRSKSTGVNHIAN